ncbi:hypothetical protein OXX79_006435 [Metschnikowia pulcherrima]
MNRKSILFDEEDPSSLSLNASATSTKNYVTAVLEPQITVAHEFDSRSDSTIRRSNGPEPYKRTEISNTVSHTENSQNRAGPHFRSADYRLVSNVFIGSIMVQYILIFFAIPFSEVDNRPAAAVLSCLLGYLSFLLCILMIPAGLIDVPTALSFQSSLISCMLKSIDLVANIYSLTLCLRVKEPMIEYTFDQDRLPVRPLDVTFYIQTVGCLLLISSVVSLILSIIVFLFNFMFFQAKKKYDMGDENKDSLGDATV